MSCFAPYKKEHEHPTSMLMYKQYGINQPAVSHKLHQPKLDEASKKRTKTTAPAEVNSMPTIRQQCPLRLLSSSTEEKPPSHREINIKLKTAKIETVNGYSSTKPSPDTANSPRKLDILLHNCYALRVQRA
jgi:hypothetical protein